MTDRDGGASGCVLPYQPFWSIIVIALAVLTIWALTTRVDDLDSSLD